MLDQQFSQSPQGLQALQQLQAQGVAGPQAQAIIATALPAAVRAMRGASQGELQLPKLGQSNYLMNFTAAAVSGLIRGEGFMGSAMDGLQGVVGGYVAQVIATRFGLPKRTAGLIGAVLTPLAIDFLWARLEGTTAAATTPQVPPSAANVGPHASAWLPPANLTPPGYAAPPQGYGYAQTAVAYGARHPSHVQPVYHQPSYVAAAPAAPAARSGYAYNPYGRR